jgi:hypothetical protein
VNWTSTTVPLWQVDCENSRKTGQSFELREVTAEEHRQFISAFCARYDLRVTQQSNIVTFQGAKKKAVQAVPNRFQALSN